MAWTLRDDGELKENRAVLTVRDVARRLNVSAQNVFTLVEAGKLVCHRIGLGRGAIGISEGDLALFLEQARQEPSKASASSWERLIRHWFFA